MNILEALINIGIRPVSATSRYGWFEAPGHTVGRPEIFVSALFNRFWNVITPELNGGAQMLASYVKGVPIDEASKMLGPVDPATPMPGRENISRSLATIDKVKPIETNTAINAVIKSEMPLDKTRRHCMDFTISSMGVSGRRVFGILNISGGIISFDFSGKPRDIITRDLALISGDGSKPGSCILVVGLEVFLRIDDAAEDVIVLPSSNVIKRAMPFLQHYQNIECVCPSYSLMHELHRNLPSANIQFSPIEPIGLWNGTLFSSAI